MSAASAILPPTAFDPSQLGACGAWAANQPLADMTWLRAGGAAQWFVRVPDEAALSALLSALPASVPLLVLGAGSNLLVRDGGVPGVVLRLGRGFQHIEDLPDQRFAVGAAVLDKALARHAMQAGVAGLEFLGGIPGTLGGALAMNAGAHGNETAAIVREVEAYDRSGARHVLRREALQFGYRQCGAAAGMVFTKAIVAGVRGEPQAIAARLADLAAARRRAQPAGVRTGGSTFKNPGKNPAKNPAKNLDSASGQKAWQLIDAAGGRGLRIGQAQMSPQHCNFMVNLGGARAAELEELGEEVQARVRAKSGCELEWELRRVGVKA